jgi:trehalose synthase
MGGLREVDVPTLPLDRLRDVIGDDRDGDLVATGGDLRDRLAGRTVWNVNSTASGGGVAEMLRVLVGYGAGLGIDVRWLVIDGDAPFFEITKRLHNHIHGSAGDGGALGEAEAAHFESVAARNATPLLDQAHAGDVVLLHDPQTAGLVAPVEAAGAHVVWRCHIGADTPNACTEEAWRFLEPLVSPAHALVFSRDAHVPAWARRRGRRVAIIPPSIDPLSAKNAPLDGDTIRRVVHECGLPGGGAVPLVVQVSRWDRLKDMRGVMVGFASQVVDAVPDAHLALVGPAVDGVGDDPEGAEVLAECTAAWQSLPADARARVHLVTLPMDDVDENARMVNALQRRATIVAQKSLAEGFGLTVAEGMWKGNPVVASAVGGIVDQVVDGTGVLLDDPGDLGVFGDVLVKLLHDPDGMAAMGRRAREHVLAEFAGDRHLLRWGALLDEVAS